MGRGHGYAAVAMVAGRLRTWTQAFLSAIGFKEGWVETPPPHFVHGYKPACARARDHQSMDLPGPVHVAPQYMHAHVPRSQSVATERILHGRVRQHHVGVTEHAQTVEAERLDVQLVLQRVPPLHVKAFRDRGEGAADVLGQTGAGLI